MVSDVVEKWKLNFTKRVSETEIYDANLFFERRRHLRPETTLLQYQAFMALVQDFGLFSSLDELTAEQHAMVLRDTIGTQYPEASDKELREILQAHMDSCALIYDEEIENALGDFRL